MFNSIERLKDYALCALALGTTPKEKWAIFQQQTKNIRVRLHLARHNPDKIYSLQTIYGPLHFRDNFGDITNLVNLFYHQTYRLKAVSQPGVILDIGANIGLAAAWFTHYNPSRPIYCFEPLASNAALIPLNCPVARVEQVAVGAQQSKAELQVDKFGVMASNIPRPIETQVKSFHVIPLDKFVKQEPIEQIALMKLDVEGMELEIFQGCPETLQKTQQVVMETHGQDRHIKSINYLQNAGFKVDSEEFSSQTGMIFASRQD